MSQTTTSGPSIANTTLAATTLLAATTGSLLLYKYLKTTEEDGKMTKKNAAKSDRPQIFDDETLGPLVKDVLRKHVDQFTSPESLLKIVRQLDFWHAEGGLSNEEMVALTENLSQKATALSATTTPSFQCPKKRFGKTELQIPIVTCGGMRLQQTWMPDFIWPLAPSKKRVLKGPSQENLMQAIRVCLSMGINHFETARMYGTSEYQFAEALSSMMESGEIKREDFIFQTKISPSADRKSFEKVFEQSWAHCQKLGHIDLFSFWCVSKKEQTEWTLAEGEDSCMAAALEYKKQGKIKHIGFSTHGTAANILELINSNKMEYVNLHQHYLGSYHAEGTPDGQGGHGNAHAVKRALELDMGVFQISPMDKGGAMYHPSKTLALTLGPKITPMEFALLTSWKSFGHHTASVGFARTADVEDSVAAARMLDEGACFQELAAAEQRMTAKMEQELGKEWLEKGLLNIPTCEVESTHGTAIGHVLWLYNLMKAFGMYDFCAARYKSLLGSAWNDKKSFEENMKKMSGGNMGRAYIPGLDYSKALESHYAPDEAIQNMKDLHEWMTSPKACEALNCEEAYDLRVWNSFPGDAPDLKGVMLQNLTFGYLGCHGGPTQTSADLSAQLVAEIKS